ncbi:DUF305 domain-containing protein [Streptomyces sp. NPDC002776]
MDRPVAEVPDGSSTHEPAVPMDPMSLCVVVLFGALVLAALPKAASARARDRAARLLTQVAAVERPRPPPRGPDLTTAIKRGLAAAGLVAGGALFLAACGGDGMDDEGPAGVLEAADRGSADLAELKALKGTEFDRAFAEMMIEHHDGAIAMAEDERKNGENPDARKMAAAVVKSRSAEVEQLQAVVDRLS